MKVLTSISTAELPATVDAVRAVVARGYDGVTTQENRHDPFVPLALAASTGLPLDLVTNVAIVFPAAP